MAAVLLECVDLTAAGGWRVKGGAGASRWGWEEDRRRRKGRWQGVEGGREWRVAGDGGWQGVEGGRGWRVAGSGGW